MDKYALKAIETEYSGYKFRSRLEARWAVFFDALQINYKYEDEGYELSDGELYLPDFYLPEFKVFVEVKPDNDVFIKYENDTSVSFIGKGKNKYGVFAYEASVNGYGVWFVFGDPCVALPILSQKQKNFFFCMANCIHKVNYKTNKKDCECICDGTFSCASKCKYEHAYCSGAITMICNEYMVWSNTQFWPIDHQILPPYFITPEFFREENNVKEFSKLVMDTKNAAMKSRQARFEHEKQI